MHKIEVQEALLSTLEQRHKALRRLLEQLPDDERKKVLDLMSNPADVPSPAEIADPSHPRTCVLMHGVLGKYFLTWGYFDGVGSVFMLYEGKTVDIWADVFPGAGEDERQAYIKAIIKRNWPEAHPHGGDLPEVQAKPN